MLRSNRWTAAAVLVWACGEGSGHLNTNGWVGDGSGDGGSPGVDDLEACTDPEIDWTLGTADIFHVDASGIAFGHTKDGNGDGRVDSTDPLEMLCEGQVGGGHGIRRVDVARRTLTDVVAGAYRASARFGDVDARPGADVIASWYEKPSEPHQITVSSASGDDIFEVPSSFSTNTWLADVDRDGDIDVVTSAGAVDAQTGLDVLAIEANETVVSPIVVAVDLDGDGAVDVLSATQPDSDPSVGNIGRVDPATGRVDEPCFSVDEWTPVVFAVGNLDDDAQGEFVAAALDRIAICDGDGSPIAIAVVDLIQPSLAGIGDLDGDGTPEILVAGASATDRQHFQLHALSRDLEPLWKLADPDRWLVFSLADLDSNGDHEVVVLRDGQVDVLDGDGSSLATLELSASRDAWRSQPVVVDIDGDGLAEIVLPMDEVLVVEGVDGGFPAPGASDGWPGRESFPGMMAADGTLDLVGAHWVDPTHNTFNGRQTCTRPLE